MKKEELLKYCRYYHGEKNCTDADKDVQMLFSIEQSWVERLKNDEDFSQMLDEYLEAGLQRFSETDDTPITLKALLFNRFTQYNDRVDVDAFKTWYSKHYD